MYDAVGGESARNHARCSDAPSLCFLAVRVFCVFAFICVGGRVSMNWYEIIV